LTRQHIGIVSTIVGTVFLAFSAQTKRQYDGKVGKFVDGEKHRNSELLALTETYIVRRLFWVGLILVALGSRFAMVLGPTEPT
jgi:hypothetical protein